jgi:hypothetical protein
MIQSIFPTAWEKASKIGGWLTIHEAATLYNFACSLPHDERVQIVEIGAYHGRSTVLLAHSGRKVTTIDPLPGWHDAEYLVTNISPHDNITWAREKSTSINWGGPPIHLLYIDGDHEAPAPKRDFEHFAPHLAGSAIVAFHDYGSDAGVTLAVNELVSAGRLERLSQAGSMWIGRYVHDAPAASRRNVFLVQPAYGGIEPEAYHAVQRCHVSGDGTYVSVARSKMSLLGHSLNDYLAMCLNDGGYDYFGIVHADLAPADNWLSTMLAEMDAHDLEVCHAVCAIKDSSGLTSTSIAYSNDPWARVRRITLTELARLPQTFTIETLREAYDPAALRLLPNTGCLVMRAKTWLRSFDGFEIRGRLRTRPEDGKRVADVVPEDWNFGHWCAEHGVRVGGTKAVVTEHFGRASFRSDVVWGSERDEAFFRQHDSAYTAGARMSTEAGQ